MTPNPQSTRPPSSKRVVFALAGVGAGNATRDLAIIHELHRLAPEVEVHAAAQGLGLDVLEGRVHLHPLRKVGYGKTPSFSARSIILSNLGFPLVYWSNRRRLAGLLRALRPGLVVVDSDFYAFGPARALGVPVLSINNSAVVMREFPRLSGPTPAGCAFSRHIIEAADFALQRHGATRVLCPALRSVPRLPPGFAVVPPIVRQSFTPPTSAPPPGAPMLAVILGGSGIGTDALDLRFWPHPIEVVGRVGAARFPPHARLHGFLPDPSAVLARASMALVQGGFSSLSEVIASATPSLVCPIPGHAEQAVNARVAHELGLALDASLTGLADGLTTLDAQAQQRRTELQQNRPPTDGARHVAATIVEMLNAASHR